MTSDAIDRRDQVRTLKLLGGGRPGLLAAVTVVVAVPRPPAPTVVITGAPSCPAHLDASHRVPGVDLSGVDLSHLDLDYADLDHANLRGATAPTTWQHGDIEYADLTGIKNADFLYGMDADRDHARANPPT